MRPLEYLRILRQRWWVLPITALVGFSLAFLTQPAEPSPAAASKKRKTASLYRASHTLISDPVASRRNRDIDWDRIALLATTGDVPTMVAREMRMGRRRSVAPLTPPDDTKHRARRKDATRGVGLVNVKVSAQPDGTTGSITLTAQSWSPTIAVRVANAFASELLVFLNTNGKAKYDAEIAQLNRQRDAQLRALTFLDYGRPGLTNPFEIYSVEAKRDVIVEQIQDINDEINQIGSTGPDSSGLRTLEPANSWTATRVSIPGPKAPILSTVESGPSRLLAGGAIGLFIGIAGLLLFEVLSARLRDVSAVEAATRLPVIAEIPEVKLGRSDWFQVLAAEEPAGLTAEAYRSLRTSMLAMWQRHPANNPANHPGALVGNGGNGGNSQASAPPLRTLLVTSSSPAEGKSVTAVNLAAAFAEIGTSVIVLDADFRRPQLDRYFARPTTPNLGDLDPDSLTPDDLEAVLQESGIPGVRFAASAPPKSAPVTAMAIAKAATVAAPALCDIVILDSPPLLLANDAADLATIVDGVVVMVRSGWTRRGAVVRATDLLRRLEATVIGTALVGVQHGKRDGYYGYYGYYGYGGYGTAPDSPSDLDRLKNRLIPWRRGRRAGTPAGTSSVATTTGEATRTTDIPPG